MELTVEVWDIETESIRSVPVVEAFAGMMAYAMSLGAGSPAAGVAMRRALAFARKHGLTAT